MTLRHLRIFLAVCDENNMTRAARSLHMTQPSVSLAVQELEEHYEALLFERLGRKLFLTEAGRRLLVYARHIIHLNKQAEDEMHSFGKTSRLRLGSSVTIGEALLIDLLIYNQQTNPQQEIFSEIHNTAELEAMLLKDELDLALVEGEIHSEYLHSQPFLQDELICIVSPQNSLATKNHLKAKEIASLGFFVRESGSGTRELFEKAMKEQGYTYTVIGVYNNAETIKKAVMANLGISVI